MIKNILKVVFVIVVLYLYARFDVKSTPPTYPYKQNAMTEDGCVMQKLGGTQWIKTCG